MPGFSAVPEARLTPAVEAANSWVETRISARPVWEEKPPAALVRAVVLMANRYLSRENSPDGFVGMQETGAPAYIGRVERDAEALIAPFRPVVFG